MSIISQAKDLINKYKGNISSVASFLPPVQAYKAVKQIDTPQWQQNPVIQQFSKPSLTQPAQIASKVLQKVPEFKPFGQYTSTLAPGLTNIPLMAQSYGKTLERFSTPKLAVQEYKAKPFATALEDVGNLADFAPAGVVLAGIAKSNLDAKALKPFLPEIRNVSKMLGNMDELPNLTPQQVKAAEEIVAKIRGSNAVEQINKLNKNPKDFYNSLRMILGGAEDQILNPGVNVGFTTKNLKLPHKSNVANAGLYDTKLFSPKEDIASAKKYLLDERNSFDVSAQLKKYGIKPDKDGLVTLYRGEDRANPDFFRANSYFTTSKELANRFGKNIHEVKVNPSDLKVIHFQGGYPTLQNPVNLVRAGNKYIIEPIKVQINPGNVAQQPLSVPSTKGVESIPVKEVNPTVNMAKTKEGGQIEVPTTPKESGTNPKPFENPSDPYYNIDRLNISDEAKIKVKSIIEGELKTRIEKTVGKTLTNKEIIKHAQFVNDNLVRSIGRDQTEKLGAAQLRLRQNIAQMSDTGKVTPELLDSIARDKAFSENTARLLQQRVINADPTTPQGKLMAGYLEDILKVNNDLDAILKKASGVDFNNPKQAAEFYRSFIKPSTGEWLDKLRYSSMLSSPNTHINNIASNFQGTGILTPIQKTIEGGIDKVVSALTGRARTRFTGEGLAYAKGYYSSVKQGYKDMLDVWKGVQSSENLDYRNIPLATKGVAGTTDAILGIVPKALESMDRFFQALTKGGLERSYKYRLNKSEKLPAQYTTKNKYPINPITGLEDLTAKPIEKEKIRVNPITPDAETEAKNLLFRGELTRKGQGAVSNFIGAGAEWVQKATQSDNKAIRWTAKLTIPFLRTGTNLVKAGVEGNPLTGALNMIGNEDKIAQAAKMIMGGSVMALTVPLALSDRITFGEPTDQKNKNAFREAGMIPYSLKIGDKWISYSKLHPLLGFQIGTVAAITDAYKKSKITEDQGAIIAEGLFNALKFYADQSYLKNVGDFVGTLSGDVEGFGRFVSNYPTQFIPFRAGMSWLNRMIDKYQRQPDTDADFFTKALQSTIMQIPGLSQTVPARLGPSGQPIENKNRFINAFSPAKISTENAEGKFTYEYQTNALRSWKNYKELKAKNPAEAKIVAAKIKKENPQLYAQMKKLKNDETLKMTDQESKIRAKGVDDGSRARSVLKLLNKYPKGSQERKDFVKRYKELGIITNEVEKQLRVLLSQ